MLCYMRGEEPYYIQYDILESIISCETAKAAWTDFVYNFKGPSDTKENKIMDLKLEYQTFRAKPFENLSQIYTGYKTLFNEFANDGVTLSKREINIVFVNSGGVTSSKHKINIGFVNNLPEMVELLSGT
ncbi:hypothetical protein Tco_0150794 [Tanacetum coccineum]